MTYTIIVKYNILMNGYYYYHHTVVSTGDSCQQG